MAGRTQAHLQAGDVDRMIERQWPQMVQCMTRVFLGVQRQRRVVSEKEKRILAYHEGGHALMSNAAHLRGSAVWMQFPRVICETWYHENVVLMGDAAHPTLPFLAQGANMALEDAAVMGRCLAAAPTPSEAFARFESLRWQRTADIVNRSRDNAQRFHNPQLADDAVAVAYVDREWQPESVRRRYDWLFEYDPLSVPL